MSTKPISVRHKNGEYTVRFEPLRVRAEQLQDAFFVTDTTVQSRWQSAIPRNARLLALPPGEQTKSMIWLERVCSWLAQAGADRHSILVALGGGVIGDLVGFAASAYMRGVQYLQVPTTLLAQVDSSVGGKVAVDLPEGKNLVGAFWPPKEVLIDTTFLDTLSQRQFRNGMAEVCKYGLIMDRPLVQKLATAQLTAGDPSLAPIIETCVRHKAAIVQADEFETTGLRATLNFGHTIGHAIEQVTGYAKFRHGEAIAIGMVAESRLGERLGLTPAGTTQEVGDLLRMQGLSPEMPDIDAGTLIRAMKRDKKAKGGSLAFSLLTQIGGCTLVQGIGDSDVASALELL